MLSRNIMDRRRRPLRYGRHNQLIPAGIRDIKHGRGSLVGPFQEQPRVLQKLTNGSVISWADFLFIYYDGLVVT